MESCSTPLLVLPLSKLVENTTKYIQNRLDSDKFSRDWICPQSLVLALALTKFYKSQNQYLPTDNIPQLKADVSLLDISNKGRASIPLKNLEAWERKARKLVSINSHADLFSSAAFLSLQQESMSVAALFRLLEAVAKSIKHATTMSTLLTTELFQARRDTALASSKLLLDNSTYELRNAPINSKSLFDGRIKEIAKSNFEAQQQRFLASTSIQSQSHSFKPPTQSRAFKIPKYPVKQTTSRPKPTQSYRSKNIPQSSSSHTKKDNIKRTGNIRQFPSSKPASSSARLWRPALSTACSSARGHSSGRTIGPFCGKMGGNNIQQMGPLYRTTLIQDTIHQNSSFVICSDQNESVLLPVSQRRDRKPSQQTGSGKGTESRNSWLLFPDLPCSKKERKVTFDNRPFFIEPIHKETGFQNGDSQVGETSDKTQRLGCLHRLNRCIPTRSDTSSIPEVSSFRSRRSSLSLHGLTVRNVPVCWYFRNWWTLLQRFYANVPYQFFHT